jgi:hypothetical protein
METAMGQVELESDAVVDLHLDLLQELLVASGEPNPFAARWLPKLTAGGVRLQGCPIYVPAEETGEAGLRVALRQINAFHRSRPRPPRTRDRGDG